jgi:hypothetical protein
VIVFFSGVNFYLKLQSKGEESVTWCHLVSILHSVVTGREEVGGLEEAGG